MNATVEAVLDAAAAAADGAAREVVATADDALAEAILELAALRPIDYERVRRAKAQQLGLRASALDAAVKAARQASGEEQARQAQRDLLVGIGAEGDLWQDDTGATFATVDVRGHAESYPVRSQGFRRHLQREYGDRHPVPLPDGTSRPGAPGSQALADAVNQLDAVAARGVARPWFVRVGWHEERVYVDLGGPRWDAVEIDAKGWRVVDRPPVAFVRPGGLKPLVRPQPGRRGIARLARLLKLKGSASRLVIGWLVGCFMSKGPYPVLVLSGEQGSGKTTLTRMCRRLVDPNTAETRTKPREERDLLIAARNGWLVAFENLSRLDQDLSDAMCRVATGAAFGTRALYTDTDEVLISVWRPQVVNAIPEVATAADLVDRAIMVELPGRGPEGTAYEADLWRRFDEAAPEILGALLTAVSTALRRLTLVTLREKPRMADFARWVEAAAPALGWKKGAFLDAYLDNRARGARIPLETDTLAQLIMRLSKDEPRWHGEPSALLDRLRTLATDEERHGRTIPKTAHHLSNRLNRLAPALRRVGVLVTRDRTGDARSLTIERVPETASSASSLQRRQALADDAAGIGSVIAASSSVTRRQRKPSNGAAHDARDADDAVFEHHPRAANGEHPPCGRAEGEL